MTPRTYGRGSGPYQDKRGLWTVSIEVGTSPDGKRQRKVVRRKNKAAAQAELARLRRLLDAGTRAAPSSPSIKVLVEAYLEARSEDLRPKAYSAAASALNRWVVPTIGRVRLDRLTPADMRAVAKAQRDAGRNPGTVHATHRALRTMLNWAAREGYQVPQPALLAKAPPTPRSDRQALSADAVPLLLHHAAALPQGGDLRWRLAFGLGLRQGEALGLTWDAIDVDQGILSVDWQLQQLPYNVPRKPEFGFRVPMDYEARQLVRAHNLVRPKSSAGRRVLPLTPGLAERLRGYRMQWEPNPWGLLFTYTPSSGPLAGQVMPMLPDRDRETFTALQAACGVAHPSGRPYTVHEARNVTATMLNTAGIDAKVQTELIGHTSIKTTEGYVTVHDARKREALEVVERGLGMG